LNFFANLKKYVQFLAKTALQVLGNIACMQGIIFTGLQSQELQPCKGEKFVAMSEVRSAVLHQ